MSDMEDSFEYYPALPKGGFTKAVRREKLQKLVEVKFEMFLQMIYTQ